jgi:DNA-binding response OmpR family regulator
MKILLLEDNIMLNEAITQYLIIIGHIVISVNDGNKCLNILDNEKFDLLIFDINVPKVDGLTILENLYNQKRMIPSIFISSQIDIENIEKAFNIGCHDYLKKPFDLKELSIRIDKITKTRKPPMKHKRLSKYYSFNHENSTLYFHNEAQIITNKQLQIIKLFAEKRGFVCSYDMFRSYVWDNDFINNATIRAEINRLKNILKENFILNIKGIGYMIENVEI